MTIIHKIYITFEASPWCEIPYIKLRFQLKLQSGVGEGRSP